MTAEEKFRETFTPGFVGMPPHIPKYIYQSMIEFTQYHIEEALKAASEKARLISDPDIAPFEYPARQVVSKESILNAYPKENIK